ncbi:Ankrd28 [Symbiodinium sp. CCMP2456]|nr:Ankrd28 [Symbiodinium sp. CCMP2456]
MTCQAQHFEPLRIQVPTPGDPGSLFLTEDRFLDRAATFPWEVNGERCAVVCSVRYESISHDLTALQPLDKRKRPQSSAFFVGHLFRTAYRDSGGYLYYPNTVSKKLCNIQKDGRCCKGLCRPSGKPTQEDCWAYSFRYHLKGGDGQLGIGDHFENLRQVLLGGKETRKYHERVVMLQIVEGDRVLGPGQREEVDMAQDLQVPIYRFCETYHHGHTAPGFLVWPVDAVTDTPKCVRGRTEAHEAAEQDDEKRLRKLKEADANLKARDESGRTPAHLAAAHGNHVVLRTLQELGADLCSADSDGRTPAHAAARCGQEAALRILKKLGVDLKAQDANGKTPAHLAAANGQQKAVQTLQELGADLAISDSDGLDPAHEAARNGHDDTVRMLSKLGVDLNVRDKHGATAAHWAACYGHDQVVRTLHELGAACAKKPDAGYSPLVLTFRIRPSLWTLGQAAAASGREKVLRTLAELGEDLRVRDAAGRTLAHYAARNGHIVTLRVLRELGVEMSSKDSDGQTPAHLAADDGLELVLRTLNILGVDMSAQDDKGQTPAHLAAVRGHEKVLQTLQELGADLSIEDSSGWTPNQIQAIDDSASRQLISREIIRNTDMYSFEVGDIVHARASTSAS